MEIAAPAELSDDARKIVETIDRHGASFATDLARFAAIEPSRARRALLELMNLGIATNDRFDPLRAGSQDALRVLSDASAAQRSGGLSRVRSRRALAPRPEGRWSRLADNAGDQESHLTAWARVLIERYGVLSREMVALESAAPSWAELAPLLGRLEWRGELRRGYFVEGLSGVQYASGAAAEELSRMAALTGDTVVPLVVVCTIDPANLYGAGAPFDINLLEGGVARLPRQPGHFLVIRAGAPVLIVESFGKRLTGLASARQADINSALGLLPSFTGSHRRILRVESYNGTPAAESSAAARLAELGFVRDYPGMAYYAGWATGSTGT